MFVMKSLGRRPTFVLAIVIAAGLGLPVPNAAAQDAKRKTVFRAGAATTDISPWLGMSMNGGMSDNKALFVHDPLRVRAMVLDDGTSSLAFVLCDSCMVPREVVAAAKTRIKERSGIDADHVVISATHAHSCPTLASVFQSDPDPSFVEFHALRIADAVQIAKANLAPAKIGWGVGSNSEQVFNRRWKMKPGTIFSDPFGNGTDTVRMNPTPGSPDLVEPAGPIDPEVSIISVQTTEGKPLALLANYSLRYVGGVGPGHSSADYFGAFADRVQQLMNADRRDPPFVAMMTNGTSGDINNINFRTPGASLPPYGKINLVADALAKEAVRVAETIEHRDHAKLDARTAELSLGVRKPTQEEIDRAETIVSKAKGPVMRTIEEIYARETLLITKYPDTVPVTVQAMRVGGLAVVAIPCEVFVEIGLAIKEKSAVKPVFTISLANGYNGYLPTREQHKLGGYETWRARSSYLEVGASEAITAKALELLSGLKTD